MSEIKRYDPNYAAIAAADDLAVECQDGMFVMHDDYAALEAECERLRVALNAIADCTPDDKARACALAALNAKP